MDMICYFHLVNTAEQHTISHNPRWCLSKNHIGMLAILAMLTYLAFLCFNLCSVCMQAGTNSTTTRQLRAFGNLEKFDQLERQAGMNNTVIVTEDSSIVKKLITALKMQIIQIQ